MSPHVPRRAFLIGLGLAAGGLAVGFAPAARAEAAAGFSPNVFVHVGPDGGVTIVCQRSEMGQGIRSSFPVVIADEMGADMARVRVVQADGDKKYGDQSTEASASVRTLHESMRRAGATARAMLVAAAASRWGVAEAACDARDHAVVHLPTGRSLGFGELAATAAKLPIPRADRVRLRAPSDLRRVGRALPHLDAPDIVAGRAAYGADVRLPGMLTAVIARPPVAGGKAARYDASRALAQPGVRRVIELPAPAMPFAYQPLGGVAVVAETTWAAMRGRAALDVTWDAGPNAAYDSARFRQDMIATARTPGRVVRRAGDVDAALARAARRVVAEYQVPHIAHAPMEPPVAVARVEWGACEVWAPTQTPQEARAEVAKALGVDPGNVTVHVTLLGCGFGRKAFPDYVVEAALLARDVGTPVRVQWTREDDLRHDFYLPPSAQRLEAGLDDRGGILGWLHRSVFPPIGATLEPGVTTAADWELGEGLTDAPLAVPNVRVEYGGAPARVRLGWVRSVHNFEHAFAIGSFVDEIALARGADPRDVLLELVGPPRVLAVDAYDTGKLRRVIERATEAARWSEQRRGGRALGVAAHRTELSYVAVVASVARGPDDKLRVDEAWMAIDAGTVINSDRVVAQMEGGFVFGMSAALYGGITMRAGAVEQSTLLDHRLARITHAPRAVHVDIVPSDARPGGVGEAGVPPVAPAIANAVFALTGRRLREMPFARSGLF
jgi:isoquinoline 1-oxidoreductase beta subunit